MIRLNCPQGTDPDNLKMVCYDPQIGMWTLDDSSQHTYASNNLNLSHVSLYAIMISNSTGMAGFTKVGMETDRHDYSLRITYERARRICLPPAETSFGAIRRHW